MVGMLIFTRVADGKRLELLQAFNALIAEERIRPYRRFVMEDVSDQSVVCWLGYWREQAIDAFVAARKTPWPLRDRLGKGGRGVLRWRHEARN